MKTNLFLKSMFLVLIFLLGTVGLNAQDKTYEQDTKAKDTTKNKNVNSQELDNTNVKQGGTFDSEKYPSDPAKTTNEGINERTNDPQRNTKATEGKGMGMRADGDSDFILNAASEGMMEVELGKLAQQKGQDPRVTAFGSMMVRDHTKANGELKAIAMRKKIEIPNEIKDNHRKMIDKLKEKSGADFDKDYIDMMVEDHQSDIDDFKKQAGDGKDTDVMNFASKQISVLQMHLDSAMSIQRSLKK